jgi:spermidine/putrescine transport system substrate-binding protein
MKKPIQIAISLLALAAAGLVAGCGNKTTLHLYTWSDYLDPELVKTFEQANNCRIKIDTFNSNEAMYAKILAGSGGYDIIFPSSYQVVLMAKQGMIIPLDKSKLPNVTKHFDPAYNSVLLDPSMQYNIPYAITFTGIAYRKDKINGKAPDSWACLDTEAYKGRISLLDDMRETIGAALKFLGYSLNTVNPDELDKARDVVLRWKKNIAKFDNEQYKTGIASGEFILGHGYNGDIAQLEDTEHIGFMLPKEGFSGACDEMVIPASAQQKDLAYAFINFMYDPDNAAQNIKYLCTVMPNKDALAKLPEDVKNNPSIIPPVALLKNCEVIKDLGDSNKLYIKVWDAIKGTEN